MYFFFKYCKLFLFLSKIIVLLQATAEQAFASITVEDWRNSCRHVSKIEKEYYERGETLYTNIERLVINPRDDSSSDDTSESEDDHNSAENSSQEAFLSGVEYLDEDILDSD